MRKKIIAMILMSGLSVAIAACGSTKNSVETSSPLDEIVQAVTQESDSQMEKDNETKTEPEQSKEDVLFEQFLNGEIKAHLGEKGGMNLSYVCLTTEFVNGAIIATPTYDGAESLSIQQITELVRQSPEIDASGARGFYAVMTTVSGGKALVVKYQGVGIDGPGDESCTYFIFTADGETLNLVYCFDSWSRNCTTVYDGAVFGRFGSSGAGDSIEWLEYVNENGEYETVYRLETLRDDWIPMYDYETFGMDTDWCRGGTICLLEVGDREYYSFDTEWDNNIDKDKFGLFMLNLENRGVEVTFNMDKLVKKVIADAGIADGELPEFASWKELK